MIRASIVLTLVGLTTVGLLLACGDDGGNPCSSTSPRSSTIIFASCQGNTLIRCVANEPGATEGTTEEVSCSDEGLVCVDGSMGLSSCGTATVGDTCLARDLRACDDQDDAVQCIWVSEEPEPGLSGDIGVWRLQEDCPAGCSGGTCD
ncbi:MAG: hypothetical protein KJO07_25405 [Deltaproteobacteria bacterium]|nr:hypothetical protein [Deltaproteobacteria bacterium]